MDFGGQIILAYLLVINAFTLVVFGWDKQQSGRGAARIPEKRLWWLSLAGGSLGGLAGMYLFRHKTRHLRFRLGIPVILVVQTVLFTYWYYGLT